MALVYRDDIGVALTVSTSNLIMPTDTVLTILIKKPGGSLISATPSVNWTTGVLTYDTVEGDLDEVGEYKVQVHGVFVDGDDLYSDRDSFMVYDKLS